MEVANLSVKLSADVENAISGLRKSDAAIQKSGVVAKKESTKIEGFMGKWKMGWIAMSTAAIASLYAIAKSSAVIGAYFSEFGALLGYVFDEIGIAMAPVIYPLLDFLWKLADLFVEHVIPGLKWLADKFADLKPHIKGLTSLLGFLAPAFSILLIPLGLLVLAFKIFKDKILPILIEWKDRTVVLFGEWKDKIVAKLSEWKIALLEKFETAKGKILEWKDKIIEIKNKIIAEFNTWLKKILIWKNKIVKYWKDLKKDTTTIWNTIRDAIWKPIQSAYNKVVEYVDKIIRKMKSIPIVGGVGKYVSKYIPEFQHGGYVPTTGLAMLHAGEHVTPAGGTTRTSSATTINYNPTFYITGEMRSDTDLRELANKLSDIMKDDVRRIIR